MAGVKDFSGCFWHSRVAREPQTWSCSAGMNNVCIMLTLKRPQDETQNSERVACGLILIVNRRSERRRSVSRRREILSFLSSSLSTHTRRRRSGVQVSFRKSSASSSFRCRRVRALGLFHGLHFRSRDMTPSPTSGVDAAWCTHWTQFSMSPVPRRHSIAATLAFLRAATAMSPTPNDSLWSPAGPVRQPATADTGCDLPSTRGSSIETYAPWKVSCRPLYSPWFDTIPVRLNWPTKPSRTTCQRRVLPVPPRQLVVPAGYGPMSVAGPHTTARRCSEWPPHGPSRGTSTFSQAATSSGQLAMICLRLSGHRTWTTVHQVLWPTRPCMPYWRLLPCWQRRHQCSICDQQSAYCH